MSSTSKRDGWTSLLRAQLTASHFSLVREKQLPGGESIFISPQADGSRRDIKGDSAGDREAGTGAEDSKKRGGKKREAGAVSDLRGEKKKRETKR